MLSSPLAFFALGVVTNFVGLYLIVGLIAGVLWLFDRSKPFPRRTVLLIALVLTVPAGLRSISTWGDATGVSSSVEEARDVNDVYRDALGGGLSRSEVRDRVSQFDVAAWPQEVSRAIVAGLELKTTRYNDVHQSLMLGEVVRTPVDREAATLLSASDVDQRTWIPRLEAAAAGGPVDLPDVRIASVDDSYTVAIAATRARLVVLDALRDVHGVPVGFSDVDEQLVGAFEWLVDLSAVDEAAAEASSVFRLLQALTIVTDQNDASDSEVAAAARAASDDPALARSYLTYSWFSERVALATDGILADAAAAGDADVSLDRMNEYRRALALPVVSPANVDAVVADGLMPWWSVTSADSTAGVLDEIEARTHAHDARFEPFNGIWSPPAEVLP